ncbi:MAG TPA: hypothetical protein DIC56_06390 [Rhizobium sp.]|nr:hypothetical protein [Rhizobium sp.]
MNQPKSRSPNPKRSARTRSDASAGMSRSAKDRYEHYIALAREKAAAGDRIEAENYYQHAEHYFRSAAALAASTQKASQR